MKTRVREFRKEKGWTIQHLADVVGTSTSHISSIETGKRAASIAMLSRIADALGVAEADVFQRQEDEDLTRLAQAFSGLSDDDKLAIIRHAQALAKSAE